MSEKTMTTAGVLVRFYKELVDGGVQEEVAGQLLVRSLDTLLGDENLTVKA